MKYQILAFTILAFGSLPAQMTFDVQFDGDVTGRPPEVSTHADPDGTFTKPSFVKSNDDYGIVAQDVDASLKGKAVLLSGKSSLDFIAPRKAFEAGRDFSLSFKLRYAPEHTDRSKYGLRINLYNEEVAAQGYQVSVLFVPSGLRILSGQIDQPIDYDWAVGEVMSVEYRVLYTKGELEISFNGESVASVSIDPAQPAGVRAFQFTGGAENSSYVAALTDIKAQLQ